MTAQESSTTCESGVYELLPAMRRLDRLLDCAVSVAHAVYGPEVLTDRFRGLHISRQEVERLLGREPGAPLLWADGPEPETASENGDYPSRMAWLQQVFGLSSFDIDVLLIVLAPQLDLRYERLYAYLQDDVSRRKPTVDLVFNLLCPTVEDKLARRMHFSSDAPLIRHCILHLLPDPNQLQPPLLSHYLKVDEQIVNLLLFQDGLDTRLAPFCRMIRPRFGMEGLLLTDEKKCGLLRLVNTARKEQRPLRLYFHGPDENNKRNAAEALAWESDMRLIVADFARAVAPGNDFARLLKVLFREAWFKNAILYLDGLDTLLRDEYAISCGRFMEAFSDGGGVTILAGKGRWTPMVNGPAGVFAVPFMQPNFADRRAYWSQQLAANGASLSESELEILSTRFRLMPHQIDDTVASARNLAVWCAASSSQNEQPIVTEGRPTLDDLFPAAREQTGHELATLAVKIEPKYRWEDIVLPDDALAHLREVCLRVAHRHVVMEEWGFDRKLSLGKGVNALFAGPSGTGKTMAAEVIATELGLDLYKIDLAGVVSKYIGETEKNLDRIFMAAENANAILFFDEADALFGKRSEVRDSHDRYANIEVSYLLQKMEQFEGIAILATNLRQNIDEAFVRRIAFTVHFPFPDEESRGRIWAAICPRVTPIAPDVDMEFFARQFNLSGGSIKNIAVAAAFLAAADGCEVKISHFFHAIRREYQKMGKQLSEAQLYGEGGANAYAVARKN